MLLALQILLDVLLWVVFDVGHADDVLAAVGVPGVVGLPGADADQCD
nr:hypothetical protein QSJ49_02150 [Halobacterium salinarum]